jgi:phage-related protein
MEALMNHPEISSIPSKTRFIAKTLSYHPLSFKEMNKETPDDHREAFLASLEFQCNGFDPLLKITHLTDVGSGVIELKRNGRPAYRCVYYSKLPGHIVVLHVTAKTTNGSDAQLKRTAKKRLQDVLDDPTILVR